MHVRDEILKFIDHGKAGTWKVGGNNNDLSPVEFEGRYSIKNGSV